MQVLDSFSIRQSNKTSALQLLQGDLAGIPPEHAVDILIISAFPGDYTALPGSMMLALKQKGLNVGDLAQDKAVDLRSTLGCWLSQPIPSPLQEALQFRQILCFEPGYQSGNPVEVVGNIFRCLNNFVFADTVNRIAMPVIGSGYQQVPFDKMLPALLSAASFWLGKDLPLDVIKIVVHDQKQVPLAMELFRQAKPAGYFDQPADRQTIQHTSAVPPLDYFISYAHTHTPQVQHFVELLLKKKPALKVFYDKTSIPPGGLWIRQISEAITEARKVIVFMSPDYSASMVCWDEFQCAKLKEYNSKAPVIQTIYLANDPALPMIMGIHSYIDCREGDLVKLAAACEQFC